MVQSFNNAKLLFEDNNIFVGINFGADATSEHEMGVKGLYEKCGIILPSNNITWENLKATKVPQTFFIKENDCAGLTIGTEERPSISNMKARFFLYDAHKEGIGTGWSSSAAGILTTKPEHISLLEEMYEAIQKKDFFLGQKVEAFMRPLVIGIYSKCFSSKEINTDQKTELTKSTDYGNGDYGLYDYEDKNY